MEKQQYVHFALWPRCRIFRTPISNVSAECRYFCTILNMFGFSRKNFIKASNIELHENASIGSRDEACQQKDGHTWRSW